MPLADVDIQRFYTFLTPTACEFLRERGSHVSVTQAGITEICKREGIRLTEKQLQYLNVFGGLSYLPFGATPEFALSFFMDWTEPEKAWQRGFTLPTGEWMVARCCDTGEFGPEGLWMAPDGSLNNGFVEYLITVSESVAKFIERDAVVWSRAYPFKGVLWIREGIPLNEGSAHGLGEIVEVATDDWSRVMVSSDAVCIWDSWTPAHDRYCGIGRVLGTRLDVYCETDKSFDRIVNTAEESGVLNSVTRAAES